MNEEVVMINKNDTGVISKLERYCYLGVKRLFDIIFGLIGCLVLIPFAIVIKVIYLLNKDTEPVFFTQNRIGKNGKEFKFYKFRSMVPNADEILFEYLKTNEDIAKEYKINKKLKNDPRITKVGHFIRNTSIDELPQLINILKGDMTLIGNRPYLPREKEDMKSYYKDIVKTKPGLTGYCKKICRIQDPIQEVEKKQHAFILQHKDENILKESTSGGAFTAIANYIIEQGGVVFGAAFDKDFKVNHIYVDNKENLYKFRNSKYVQSNINDSYTKVKEFLDNNKLVCFSGTPCQVEGLQSF